MIDEYKIKFSEHVKQLQNQICEKMQDLDIEIETNEDIWQRVDYKDNPGGGGITRALMGRTFENAGVNTSEVFGDIDPEFAKSLNGEGAKLWASGISLIIHPKNPKVPTVHANFRMIEQGGKFWFGGGADLTPFYPHEEDFQYFHGVWKKACAPYNCYQAMKVTCDKYFVNHHRNGEMRGIGGIFFDHLNTGDIEKDFNMVKDLSTYFIESYFPLVEKRMNEEYTDEDVEFQHHRRGRYVEFNLLHDRGTLFGLRTKGRVDSILISLPHTCKYTYKYAPKEGTPHAKMMDYYFPKEW